MRQFWNWVRVCALAAACCAFLAAPLAAQCPPKTTVADTLYNADGTLASGRVSVSWPTFQIGACTVIAGRSSVTVVNGALSVLLYPNDAAAPAGTSYRVSYVLKSGQITTEYWVVPTNATPVPLSSVRSPTVPVPNVMFSESQVTNLPGDLGKKLELPSPCPAGKILQANGSPVQPQVDCVDSTGGGGSSTAHQVNGTNLASSSSVNFQDSSTIVFANPSAGNVQAGLKDAAVSAAKLNVSSPTAAQLSGVGDSNIAAGALSANRVSGTAVVQSRAVNTSAPLSGGGDLSADRTLTCPTCEVTSNKGAANGYAALNASAKVSQDPANAQTTPAAAKIPLADATGKIADGWLSSNVSLLGSAIDDSELANAYSGVGTCANQFVRGVNRNAAPTCASVTSSDTSGTFPAAPHNLLSSTHGDTTAASPVRGDGLFAVGATPTWQRVAHGATSGSYFKWNGTDVVASTGAAAGTGACGANTWASTLNADAAPTCTQPSVSNLSDATNVVKNNQANTWTTGAQDMSSASSFIVPKAAGAAPTADGDVRYDSTQASLKSGRGDVALTGFIPRVIHASHQAQQITNSVTSEQDFTSQFTLPANFFLDKKATRVCAGFHVNSSASSVPTHVYKLKLGSTVVWSMPATSPGTSQNSGFEACWTVMATGAPGASVNTYTESVAAGIFGASWKNATNQPVAVATNASQAVTISITFSNTTAGNNVTLEYLVIRENY